MSHRPTALIAEDEPLLAQSLQSELARAWPELDVIASARHGRAAVEQTLALQPEVVFLDIRMPGMSGIDAAEAIAEDWPEGRALPLIVFVTAYEQYAVQAFERSASDYLLKPVQPARLRAACTKLRAALASRHAREALPERHGDRAADEQAVAILTQLRALLGSSPAGSAPAGGAPAGGAPAESAPAGNAPAGSSPSERTPAADAAGSTVAAPDALPAPLPRPRLTIIQASNSSGELHMVPVSEVVYFEAADKVVRVLTAEREVLIRTSLKELMPQLDPDRFWQIHRGTLVRDDAVRSAARDENGRLWLTLRSRPERLAVSRLYAARFKAM